MTNLEFLLQRQSNPQLTEPAPNKTAIENILAAGMRVPDHAGLKPWHFTVISGEGLQRLSDLYVDAFKDIFSKPDNQATAEEIEQKLAKAKKMPFRAPLIIVISTKLQAHEKVPEVEQVVAAGCCAHAMQMAATTQGFGAMWRTGDLAYNDIVKQGLGVAEQDHIIGFLYIGTPCRDLPLKPSRSFVPHVNYWQ